MSAERISRRAVLAGMGCALGSNAALAQQGFAGLGESAEGFAEVTPGRALRFPDDLGAHPGFRTEWWYATANLRREDGEALGVQWTLFRQQTAPGEARDGWGDPSVWMGHAAVTTEAEHRFAQRLGRGGIGQAGAAADPFEAWIDNWSLRAEGGDAARWLMKASGQDFAFALDLDADGPFVAHGDGGYSRKSDQGQASYYFSQPFLRAEGVLTLDGVDSAVSGRAWLDREWSTQALAPEQEGWDWFSLYLEGGARLMGFRLREKAGPEFRSGTWIAPDGTATPLGREEIELTPLGAWRVAGRRVPARWRIKVPARGVDVTAAPLNPAAWNPGLVAYWEGPVMVSGSHGGEGYLEMTGY